MQASVAAVSRLSSTGSIVVMHGLGCSTVCGSQIRNQTRVSCIGGQILYHFTIRGTPDFSLMEIRTLK